VDVSYDSETERFRAEFRDWLDANLPADWRASGYWERLDPDEGFATRRIGNVSGVLTLERREDGLGTITWTGFEPATVGSLAITLVGTAAGDDFAREEPLLGAIFESISFD